MIVETRHPALGQRDEPQTLVQLLAGVVAQVDVLPEGWEELRVEDSFLASESVPVLPRPRQPVATPLLGELLAGSRPSHPLSDPDAAERKTRGDKRDQRGEPER